MADNGDPEKADGSARPAKSQSQRSEGNEWTLSDSRGPLGAAGLESDDPTRKEGPPPVPPPETAAPEPFDEPAPTKATAAVEPPANPAATNPAATNPPVTEQPRHMPVLPIIAALVVGAIIGAGSAGIIYKSVDQGASQGDVNALSSRIDALEKRPDPQPELDRLKASLDKAAAAPKAQAFDPAPLQQKVDALAGDVDGLKKQDANQGLADKVTALEGTIAGLKTQGADVKGLDDKVAGLATTTDGVKDKLSGLVADVDGLKKQDQATQAGIATLQSGQKTLEAKAGAPALAVVADSLIEAISRGKPYASQVEAAASLGADPAKVAILRENADKGVPSAQALAAGFAPLADPIAASANHAPANAGLVDRLKSGMLSMVSIRRADGTTGNDPGSRASLIEADLAHDDVAGAYAAWEGLPADAKARSDAWGALAKTHVEAMAAARALQQQAIAALGGKKS